MNAGDVSLACASLLADQLALGGVDCVCLSPGSRSTPLALAFARDGRFEVHVHLDERASAFFALGRAKATGRPVALVCTSGTATANYLPAVVEASQGRVPMIVLTADRPPALRGTGANQTIDQRELYGSYARLFVEASLPAEREGTRWRALASDLLAAAFGPPAGPVHLNLPFDEPLIPSGEAVDIADAPVPLRPVSALPAPAEADLEGLRELIDSVERGVIFAGWLARPAPGIVDLASKAGWPLIAEPHSNLRVPGALSAPQAIVGTLEPEVVLQFGGTPTSRASLAMVARAGRLITVDADGWRADPAGRAERVVRADPETLTGALSASVERRESAWCADVRERDARARAAMDAFLDELDVPFEPAIARDLAARLPAGATLVIGNSTPVRDLDLAMAPRDGLRVLANRGASGIDGLVSTTLGVASAGAPTTALIGDLTLLHDIGSLLWCRDVEASFVVIDNAGGGIFDLLPSSALPENERLFVAAPRGVDLAAIADARVTRIACDRRAGLELRAALKRALDAAIA